ncbi:unnamed protein product [Microthlaspi erraticum]|uniref:Uncharacterized protein n=1 Tax=Microthlaspi erraticum TaxID=1685480 RepID=A0A6D2HQD3_9BRAS|nr:unnamed protein product [Microthlaspi erraticum]
MECGEVGIAALALELLLPSLICFFGGSMNGFFFFFILSFPFVFAIVYLGLEKFWADGRWILSRSSDLVGQIRFGRENFGRGRVCFPDRPAVGPFRYKIRPIAAYFFPVRACARTFCRAMINPAEHKLFLPGSTVTVGPVGNCSAKISLRVRGQCFGADCVFTPFSPSILS